MTRLLMFLGDRWRSCWIEHESIKEWNGTHLYLRCLKCQLRTPGIRIGEGRLVFTRPSRKARLTLIRRSA